MTAEKWKFYGLLVGLITTLVATTGTYFKAKNETIARDSYKVNVALIARLSDESVQNHKDILALREYIDQHITGTTAAVASAPPPLIAASAALPAPPPPIMKTRPAPVKLSKSKAGAAPEPAALTVFDKDGNKSTITVPEEWPQ